MKRKKLNNMEKKKMFFCKSEHSRYVKEILRTKKANKLNLEFKEF